MSAHASHRGLTFEWPLHGKISPYLIVFMLASALLHALGFYIFQVVYPPTVSIAPPPAVVTLLAPTTPENITLLQWVAANDPALISASHEVLPAHLFDLSYKPSFAGTDSLPRVPGEKSMPVNSPPAKDVLALISSATKPPDEIPAANATPLSEMRFSGGLVHRTPIASQPVQLATKSSANLEPASFLVAVAPDGSVRFSFLQKTSGDKTVDQQAESYLARLKFAPASGALAWGTATFFWGNDAFEKQKPEGERQTAP